jgi:hypothetical protein
MSMHDDRDLEDRFERRMAAVDAEIPSPPPMHTLRRARPMVTSRGGAGSRGSWSAALALVVVVAAATPASPAPAAPSPSAEPPASPAPVTAGVPAVNLAIQQLNLEELVHGLVGGGGCTVQLLQSGSGSSSDPYAGLQTWGSATTYLVTCPHAVGDATIGLALDDALTTELTRLGTTLVAGHGWMGDATADRVPSGWVHQFVTDKAVGTTRVGVLYAQGAQLEVIVSIDQLIRNPAG